MSKTTIETMTSSLLTLAVPMKWEPRNTGMIGPCGCRK